MYDLDRFADPFEGDPEVWITSFWGWSPETWGCIGFTQEARRTTFLESCRFPFLMIIYVTGSAPHAPASMRGRVVGFYEVGDQAGDRDEFMAREHHSLEVSKWRYSLRALRAFEILPEFRPTIGEFDPSIRQKGRELSVAKHGAQVSGSVVEKLKALPRREVPVFGVNRSIEPDIVVPKNKSAGQEKSGYVRGGAGRRRGYAVGEPANTEKELYVLKLSGEPEVFLGRSCPGQSIYKVGLSLSPETRASAFNNAMPQGAFKWSVFKSTSKDGHGRYSSFEVAEKGEMAMKQRLGQNSEDHLGGEFYLARANQIEDAWKEARRTALSSEQKTNE